MTDLASRYHGPGVSARAEASEAISRLGSAILAWRSAVVRALVEEDGLTRTEAAAILGVSRQLVGRMYDRAIDGS